MTSKKGGKKLAGKKVRFYSLSEVTKAFKLPDTELGIRISSDNCDLSSSTKKIVQNVFGHNEKARSRAA